MIDFNKNVFLILFLVPFLKNRTRNILVIFVQYLIYTYLYLIEHTPFCHQKKKKFKIEIFEFLK